MTKRQELFARVRQLFIEHEDVDQMYAAAIKANFGAGTGVLVVLEDLNTIFVVGGLTFAGCCTLVEKIGMAIEERVAQDELLATGTAGEA
jgi:hypothetical protein